MPDAKDIIRAAKKGDAVTVGRILDADPSLLCARDKDGSTPLHCAAWNGRVEVVRLLLERGADTNLESQNTHWGGTPLHAAAHGNHLAIADLLANGGADVNVRSFNGRTPLEETSIHKATAVAKLLKELGARS